MSGSTENPNSKAAPNITPDVATGTGRWTPDEWMQFLASGRTPRGRQVTGEMAEVIESLNLLSKKDQAAMVAYLISLPAKTGIRPEK